MEALEICSKELKKQFPLLKNGAGIYLDSAATTHKPLSVIAAESKFYSESYATVNRSLYPKAQEATQEFYEARRAVQGRIGADSTNQVIFTKGATDSLNQVSQFLLQLTKPGDEILLSPLEHHANYLPFLALEQKGLLKIRHLPIQADGKLDLEALLLIDLDRVKALSVAHVSNVTGVEQDLDRIGQLCKERGWIFIVDAAQSIAHTIIDVQVSQIDFLAFSSHKMYGPTGVGVLYMHSRFFELLDPIVFGGDMIAQIGEKMVFQDPPLRFEAGTPPIAQVIGLKAALAFQNTTPFQEAAQSLKGLTQTYLETLGSISGWNLISSLDASSIITMTLSVAHPMDVALLLGNQGIELRSGSLCALPALKHFQANAFLRLSLGVYNTIDEVERFSIAFEKTLLKLKS
ncbi:MAG: aminotransferase class V-fold PLP-dependent enzyme [Chlamydiia bacterium]